MAVSARPLSYDAVFRIEVSLSSRKSSAIVMRTTARLYTLEGTPSMMGGTGSRLHSGVSQPYCPICQAFHPLPLPTAWGHNNASQTQPTTVSRTCGFCGANVADSCSHTHPNTPSHPHPLTADVEWKSVAYGAPCIQLMKETTDHNSPFNIKIVIAEVESGERQMLGQWRRESVA